MSQTRQQSQKGGLQDVATPSSTLSSPTTPGSSDEPVTSSLEELPLVVRHHVYDFLGFPVQHSLTLRYLSHTKKEIELHERYNIDFNREGLLSQPWNVSLPSSHSSTHEVTSEGKILFEVFVYLTSLHVAWQISRKMQHTDKF